MADRRFAVADFRVNRDARQKLAHNPQILQSNPGIVTGKSIGV
jgi:hypothetical protein